MARNFQNLRSDLASLPAAPNLKFEREDWTPFPHPRRSAAEGWHSRNKLSRLVLKESADNGLDAGPVVEVGELSKGDGYFVGDDGPGARLLHEINTACGQF